MSHVALLLGGRSRVASGRFDWAPCLHGCSLLLLFIRTSCLACPGHSVIIDRTNIDIAQRSTWVSMAQRFGLAHVEALFLAVPVAVCKQRVLDRINHETL